MTKENFTLPKNKPFFRLVMFVFTALVCICLLYNCYSLFFPLKCDLGHDEAEHLHVAHLLSTGERPFLDFLENHPMLFHHFINWGEKLLNFKSVRATASFARGTILAHFIICLVIFCLWASRLLKNRLKGLPWMVMLVAAWAMVDLYHPYLAWVWHIRPDFICCAYTLAGSFLFYLWLTKPDNSLGIGGIALLILAGCLVGLGNAILPKGGVLILALIMTAICTGCMKGWDSFSAWFVKNRIMGIMIFILATGLSFGTFVLVDCHLSNIPIKKWIAGVLLINSKKHIVYSPLEDNPITSLTSFFSLPLPVLLGLSAWILWQLARLRPWNTKLAGENYILLFAVFTIAINLLVGPFTNGVTWSYNFIPSMFAVAGLYLLLVHKARQAYATAKKNKRLQPGQILFIVAAFALACSQMAIQPLHAMATYNERQSAKCITQMECSDDFVRDEVMPANFTYLAHYPPQIPVKGRHWGFYFFLSENRHFWRDCHLLGIGPDPQVVFKKGFGENPPDALVFEDLFDLKRYVLMVKFCHSIDVSWILDEVQDHYVPMSCKGIFLYARRDRVQTLVEAGWKIVEGKPSVESTSSITPRTRFFT